MSAPELKGFASDLGTEMVTLFVGEEKKKFHVHKKLLCDKVPVFKAMFAGAWKEAEEGVANLPEDNVGAVEVLVEWLYRGCISPAEAKSNVSMAVTYGYAFCFAEKYCIDALMDQSISLILATLQKQHLLYNPQEMADFYNSTRDGSRLRLYIARSLCYVLLEYTDEKWKNDTIQKAFGEAPDLCRDVIAMIRKQGGKHMPNTCSYPTCDYHQHDSKTPCPSETKKIEVMVTDADGHQSKKRGVKWWKRTDDCV